jgi:hypothetical protein
VTIADIFTPVRCAPCGKTIRKSKALGWEDSTGFVVWFNPAHDLCLSQWNIIRTQDGYYHIHDLPPEDDALPEAYPITAEPATGGPLPEGWNYGDDGSPPPYIVPLPHD